MAPNESLLPLRAYPASTDQKSFSVSETTDNAHHSAANSHGLIDEVIDFAKQYPVSTTLACVGLAVASVGLAKVFLFEERAGALAGEADNLVHLTNPFAAEGIAGTEKIGGRFGVFAVKVDQVPTSPAGRLLNTLVPRDLSAEVSITGDAARAFRAPEPLGPFALARRLGGVRSTPLGSVDLSTNQFIPNEIFSDGVFRTATRGEQLRYKAHQFMLDYLIDAEAYVAAGCVGYAASKPRSGQVPRP